MGSTGEIELAGLKKTIYRSGVFATLFMLLMIPVQIACFIIWPHPADAVGWLLLFQQDWIIGLVSFDFLYMLSMFASVFLYVALFVALFQQRKALSLFAIIIGLIGLTIYFPSNTSVEMLMLSKQYFAATTDAEKAAMLASAQVLLLTWKGTAYAVYYVLNGAALILFFVAMLKNLSFRKSTAYFGLTAGVLMTVPATAGIIGMSMALLSLIPWSVFSVLVIFDFMRLVRQK